MPGDSVELHGHSSASQRQSYWPKLPLVVRQTFDKFPLVTYPANELPGDSSRSTDKPKLYTFSTVQDATQGRPSFNPSCLKWQTFLLFQDVDFLVIPSNNHAAPAGQLPFLSHTTNASAPRRLIPSNRIHQWTEEKARQRYGAEKEPDENPRYEAYMSLIEHRIRSAYLYALYLSPTNFTAVARPLYIEKSTSNPLVRHALALELQLAARQEIVKQHKRVDAADLYRECGKAFEALSDLLGDEDFFFASPEPTLFDATVFSYTQVLLDEHLQWKDRRLQQSLSKHKNLIDHRKRILEKYYN